MKTKLLFITAILLPLFSCGGSSSSDSGILIEGTLIEGGGTVHANSLEFKHSAGESIELVEICAFGNCSITDSQGQWGIVAPDSFKGGEAVFTIKGHGIDTQSNINIPQASDNVYIKLSHQADKVNVAEMRVDGVPVTIEEEHDHSDHAH